MSGKLGEGLGRAIGEGVGGLIIPIFISSIISKGLIPFYFIWVFHLVSIYDMISLINEMSLWNTSYIIGWLIGVFFLAYSGLLGIDFLIYLIPLGFLVFRFSK